MDPNTTRSRWVGRAGAAMFLFFAVKGLAWLAIGGGVIAAAW